MTVIAMIQRVLPYTSKAFIDRLHKIHEPRFLLVSDIGHWVELRGQINATTGRINSYRDIRRICEAEGGKVPALGTLRNYLGEGGVARQGEALGEWLSWFEQFGQITEFFKDELLDTTTAKDWELFRAEYNLFLGY